MNYYIDCIENTDDVSYVNTYLIDSFDLEMFADKKRMKLNKEEVDNILKMLNVNQDKVKEKYKLAFNVLSISNFEKEIIPLVYIAVSLNVFNQEITMDTNEQVFHQRNIAKLTKTSDIDSNIFKVIN